MDLAKNQKGNGGVGFLGLLTVVFIVLKLTKAIDWSWYWIISPLWGGFVLISIILCGLVLISALSRKKL